MNGLSQLIEIGVAEVTRRGDLRDRLIVHEHEFDVRLDRRRNLIVRENTADVALVRTNPVVERCIIVTRATRFRFRRPAAKEGRGSAVEQEEVTLRRE